ncbi:hypothetical protein [Spiroplasma sp. DGKH1]|uniref:hypothetical protein n=1 Tax=Spiroplasma sp. DGKH1 TaxID=3050074 RepID=UPI0034C6C85F
MDLIAQNAGIFRINSLFQHEKLILVFALWIIGSFIAFKLVSYVFKMTFLQRYNSIIIQIFILMIQLIAWGILSIKINFSNFWVLPIRFALILEGVLFLQLISTVISLFVNKKIWKLVNNINFIILYLGIGYVFFNFILLINSQIGDNLYVLTNLLILSLWFVVVVGVSDYRLKSSKKLFNKFFILPLLNKFNQLSYFNHPKIDSNYLTWAILKHIISIVIVFELILNNLHNLIIFFLNNFISMRDEENNLENNDNLITTFPSHFFLVHNILNNKTIKDKFIVINGWKQECNE